MRVISRLFIGYYSEPTNGDGYTKAELSPVADQ
jgi:hypothetical protein